jgi:F-type H+-transporting ATPase subunit a
MNKNNGLDFFIHGYKQVHLFGMNFYITTTHVCMAIVFLVILGFGIVAHHKLKKADPTKAPGKFVNVLELLVEKLDGLLIENMGPKMGPKFSNYVGTLFLFILCCNLGGLFGLRSPTADFGVTFPLAMITFVLIQFQGFKAKGFGKIKELFEPIFLFFPMNVIGEVATPISMSLRLFGNILSGTIMMALIYGLLPKALLLVWPAALHAYLDVFAGALQAYVFCILTMVFIKNAVEE